MACYSSEGKRTIQSGFIRNNDKDYVRYRHLLSLFVLRLTHQFVIQLETLIFISVLSFAHISKSHFGKKFVLFSSFVEKKPKRTSPINKAKQRQGHEDKVLCWLKQSVFLTPSTHTCPVLALHQAGCCQIRIIRIIPACCLFCTPGSL